MVDNSGYTNHCCGARRAAGFSIVELMVTVTVAAVLLGLAIPSFRDLLINNKVTEASRISWSAILNLARSEAVRRGTLAAVISTSGSNDWSTGWYVESDGDFKGNGTFAGNSTTNYKQGFSAAHQYGCRYHGELQDNHKGHDCGLAIFSAIAVSDGIVIFTRPRKPAVQGRGVRHQCLSSGFPAD